MSASEPLFPDEQAAYLEESEQLAFVLSKIHEQLGGDARQVLETDDEDEDADEALTADEVAEVTIHSLAKEKRRILRAAEKEPYFGRLDVDGEQPETTQTLYIGKRGIDDPATAERMVLDWRAPAASMFYAFNGQGDTVSYEAPEGHIEHSVSLKRNIVVRDSSLQRVVDSYKKGHSQEAVTDEFLLYRLAENKDSRLRDIVSTIQSEQNDIIRADRNRAIVIQGVAGSGKTTVALHRLAYLLYQNQDRLRADRMVIFAPTAMFVDYISEVLPELGVGGIQQTTFHAWALRILDFQVALEDQRIRLRDWFGLHEPGMRKARYRDTELKGRISCLCDLDAFLASIEKDAVPHSDFVPFDGQRLPYETIYHWFHEEYRHYPFLTRQQRVLARVKRFLEIAVKEQAMGDSKALKKQAMASLKQYEKSWWSPNALEVYQAFLAQHQSLSTDTISQPKRRGARVEVQSEDIPLLLHIHQYLRGLDARDTFDHVVIDEAQDFSPVQISILQRYCKSGSFTILGDLSQSIHTYQGITNWDDFTTLFPEGMCDYFQLDVSYRSTYEIIEFANAIIRPFDDFIEAKPVFRSGEDVVVRQVPWERRLDEAVDVLHTLKQQASTVALLARTEEDAHVYHLACLEAGLDAHLIEANQTEYHGGISIVPIYLAKGFEFDSVLIVDADERHYEPAVLSGKLLYVGCTRALHTLWVQYSDTISPLLSNS